MKNYHNLFTLFLVAFSLISCSNSSENDLIDEPLPEAEIVTYNTHVKTIIDNNCISCHSNPPTNGAPISLTTYGNVKNAVENSNLIGRISAQVGETGAMPFGGPRLPQSLIDIIIQWEADGLLESN